LRTTCYIIASILCLGCARQNSPTGGEKDVTPPQVVTTDPPVLSTEFSSSEFSIEFDEYIQVKDLTEQLIISPPLKKNPEYTLKGRTFVLFWEESLRPNTTYQFNFGTAISDITEGNSSSDLIYVFSTGNYIDSLVLEGTIIRAEDNKPVEDVAVMLYRNTADSLPYTTRPDFFGLTNESGNFRIGYLPPGSFKLFALKEESSNYLYDGPPEQLAFLSGTIASQPDDSLIQLLSLPLFTEKDTVQYLLSTENRDYGFHRVIFNLPTKEPSVTFLDTETEEEISAMSLLSESRDTLTSWVTMNEDKPIPEEIQIITEDITGFVDTSFWYPETDPEYRVEPKLKIQSNLGRNKLNPTDDIRLNFSNPIEEVDTSLILLLKDSVATPPKSIKKSVSGLHLFVEIDKDPEARYSLILDEGAVRDIFGVYSDSSFFGFRLEDKEYYGRLSIAINDSLIKDQPKAFYELLNEQGKPLKSGPLKSGEPLEFERMNPGKYGFRLTLDENENGKWDTGNYREGIQPEVRIFYTEPIEIRSNWDLELDWLPAPPLFTTDPR